MKLFFDENFPPYLPEALRLFGFDAIHALEEHEAGTTDVELFAELGDKGWIWVSHDKGAKRKPHERRALIAAGLGAFIFTGRSKRTAVQMMIFVLSHIDEMIDLATRVRKPFIYGLSDRGKFERLG